MDLHALERPILAHFRMKRLALFYRSMRVISSSRLLDLGGSLFFWQLAEEQGLPIPKITIVNLAKPRTSLPPYVEWIVADALQLQFRDNEFDFVFCNSLIEHLHNRDAQQALAHEIERLAPRYFVQTPDRRFFFEPHLLTPFVHWLPVKIRKKMIRNFTFWGLLQRPSVAQCERFISEVCLLNAREMTGLFPRSEIHVEKFAGMPKSIIAMKR